MSEEKIVHFIITGFWGDNRCLQSESYKTRKQRIMVTDCSSRMNIYLPLGFKRLNI